MVFDKPVTLQRRNSRTEKWEDAGMLHASINHKTGKEKMTGGGTYQLNAKTFKVRWSPLISEIDGDTQSFRLIYRGKAYDITDYDDFMEQHRAVTLTGEYSG